MAENLLKERLQRFEQLKSYKHNFTNLYQEVSEIVWTVKSQFNTTKSTGEFLNTKLFDNTANQAMKTRASTMLNIAWGNGDFALHPSHPSLQEDEEAEIYFKEAGETLSNILKRPEVNLVKSIHQAELYDASFGTDCIFVSEDKASILRFNPIDISEVFIDENQNGIVDTLYRKYTLPLKEAVNMFGVESLSASSQARFKDKQLTSTVDFLHVVQPRKIKKVQKGNLSFPFESVYIELGGEGHLVKESGFQELPFFVYREPKMIQEKYGRGSGVDSISDNKDVQKSTENVITIGNRIALPPLGGFSSSVTGNEVNTSPDGFTAFSPIGNVAGKPLFNLIDEYNGSLPQILEIINFFKDNIMKAFNLDVLLDTNEDGREITATEIIERKRLRQQSLGAFFLNRISERYIPLINTSFRIIERSGAFGNRPESINRLLTENPDLSIESLFTVEFFSQFARESNYLKAQSYLEFYQAIGVILQITQNPNILDNIDSDKIVREIADIMGVNEVLIDEEAVEETRQQKIEQQEEDSEIVRAKEGSEVVRNLK